MSVFETMCVQSGIDPPEKEYMFCPGRKFRFDHAWPRYLIALEIEGGAYHGPGHRSVGVFLRNMEKYNLAAIAGWKVLRVTTKEFDSGIGLELVMRAMEASK